MKNKKQYTVKDSWQNCIVFIVDKISMVFLKLLSIIDSQLSEAKGKKNNHTAIFDYLVLVIFIENFYQFPFMVKKSLWNKVVTFMENYGKKR